MLNLTFSISQVRRFVSIKTWPTLENPWLINNKIERPRVVNNYEESKADFEHVKRLIANKNIPAPPTGPTVSGWVPQDPKKFSNFPYYVNRTRNHMLPIYHQDKTKRSAEKALGIRQITVIRHIEGDIQQLRTDLEQYLSSIAFPIPAIQACELTSTIRINGIYQEEVSEFLLERGF